ncbi:unnamed protein product [Rotaria sp. Silwood1]|nr:unnamed protein product [Rotaria sp. Silwood1]
MMDPTSLVIRIAQSIVIFHNTLIQVKANKKQCQRLGKRIETISNHVKSLQEADLIQKNIGSPLDRFDACIRRCTKFITKFAKASWFEHIFANQDHREEFAKLNLELSGHAIDLQLSINIEQLFDRKKDESDRMFDLAAIEVHLNEIGSMMAKNQLDLLGHLSDLKLRVDSYRLELQQTLEARRSTTAQTIKEERTRFRHIPLHDLISEELIGEGSFANVYRGQWLSQHHQVAIKVIRVGQLSDKVTKDFIHEISTMHQMRFDNILTIFGACMEPNYHALVVEYMELGSLASLLQKSDVYPLSWSERWSIALQMVKGINYLHLSTPHPIIHCDIKSSNFVVNQNLKGLIIKVGDFGLAKIRQETIRQTNATGGPAVLTAGTLQWKAPELFKFSEKNTTASDVYALGIVFWELATRCIPYEHTDDAVIRVCVMAQQRLDIPVDVPPAFASLIQKSWSHEPTQRPSCKELILNVLDHQSPRLTAPELMSNDDKEQTT